MTSLKPVLNKTLKTSHYRIEEDDDGNWVGAVDEHGNWAGASGHSIGFVFSERTERYAPGQSIERTIQAHWAEDDILRQRTIPVRARMAETYYNQPPRSDQWLPDTYAPAVWLFEDRPYQTNDLDLTPEDVKALINEARNKRRIKLEKAHALQAMADKLDDTQSRSRRLSQATRLAVWQRDKGRCVECGSKDNLEFDHIIPHSMGGSNTERNIQLLCEECNRRKSASFEY